jgi:hypothetical protein
LAPATNALAEALSTSATDQELPPSAKKMPNSVTPIMPLKTAALSD